MRIHINTISYNRSLVDGPGVRTVVFFQGCDLHCKGCHNKETWDINKGIEYDTSDLVNILKEKAINKKITFSGGEPLMQQEALIDLILKLKDFDIALYTGHDISDVPKVILDNIKYIKYGPFDKELKTSIKSYVGSSNQIFRRLK